MGAIISKDTDGKDKCKLSAKEDKDAMKKFMYLKYANMPTAANTPTDMMHF